MADLRWVELIASVTSKLLESREKFKDTMITKVQVLEDLDVWEKVDVPSGTSMIRVKWVLKEKQATSLSPASWKHDWSQGGLYRNMKLIIKRHLHQLQEQPVLEVYLLYLLQKAERYASLHFSSTLNKNFWIELN